MSHQRPGVYVGDAHDVLADQLVFQCSGGPPVQDPRGGIAHRVTGHPDLVATAFAVLTVPPGVADLGSSGHHDLPVIARVGQRLLVPGHAGGKDCLAKGLADRAERRPGEGAAVIEDEHRLAAPLFCAGHRVLSVSHRSYSLRSLPRKPRSISVPEGNRHRIARIPSCELAPARPSRGRREASPAGTTLPTMPRSVRMAEIDSCGIQIGPAPLRSTKIPSV